MGNKRDLPVGSKITVDPNMHSTTYTWQTGDYFVRYVIGTFFVIFLCGWTVVGLATITDLLRESDSTASKATLLFWLFGWAAGVISVVAVLYFLFGPRKPAKLILAPGTLAYHTGTGPIDFQIFTGPKGLLQFFNFLKNLRNKVYEIQASELTDLRLARQGERQTLTFDYASEKIEIGKSLSEPEREWLHEILLAHIKQFGKT
jgi:hypothetical protein